MIFVMILFLSGCAKSEVLSQLLQEDIPLETLSHGEENVSESWNTLNSNEDGDVTPYQFLYFLLGNVEELSFQYEVMRSDTEFIEKHHFQRKGESSVDCFSTKDMNGNTVNVREMEKDNKTHYIMDDTKTVKTYHSPATDFLLYKMITASKTLPDRVVVEGEYMLYEYSMAFEEDEMLEYRFCFYMKNNVLEKVSVFLGDREGDTYKFSDFHQEITDVDAFEYPLGYKEESFDYSYEGDYMPPWWESGNVE